MVQFDISYIRALTVEPISKVQLSLRSKLSQKYTFQMLYGLAFTELYVTEESYSFYGG